MVLFKKISRLKPHPEECGQTKFNYCLNEE
jgi:hypothetical protein